MKIRYISAIAGVLVLAAAIGATSATAQSVGPVGVKADIPFEFYANDKLYPAGTYTLSKVNQETLRLHDSQGRSLFIQIAARDTVNPEDRNWIVFHQYGNTTFVAGAYWSGSSVSLRLPESRAEREVAKRVQPPNPITIAAR